MNPTVKEHLLPNMVDLSKLSKTGKQRKADEFIKDYMELCEKHGLQFLPRINLNENGLMPKLDVVEYVEPRA